MLGDGGVDWTVWRGGPLREKVTAHFTLPGKAEGGGGAEKVERDKEKKDSKSPLVHGDRI